MAGAGSAILDYEVKVYVEDWRGVGPNDHGATVPALDSCVYVRNKTCTLLQPPLLWLLDSEFDN